MTGNYLCMLCTVVLAGCSFSLNVTSTQPPVAITTTTTHETGVEQTPVLSSDEKPKQGVLSKKGCEAFVLPEYTPPKIPRFTDKELEDSKLVNIRLLQHIEVAMLAQKEYSRLLVESHRRHLKGCQ